MSIKKLVSKPTSPKDLYLIAGGKFNIFRYSDINNFDKVDDLFEPGNSEICESINLDLPFNDSHIILLYNSEPSFGHWCSLSRNDYGYNFMDSYGGVVDDPLDFVDDDTNKELGQEKKHLAKLLLDSNKDVYYNDFQLQKLSNDVATCGRYCAVYFRYNDLKIDDFVKGIKKLAKKLGIDYDTLIVYLSVID